MTGFAQVAAEIAERRVEVSVQAVNHRNLDLVFRLPEELRPLESELRRRVTGRVARGRCEVSIRWQPVAPRPPRIRISAEAVRAVRESARELVDHGLVEDRLTLGELLRLPQLIEIEVAPVDWDDAARQRLIELVEGTLAAFDAARSAEGARLGSALERLRGELSGHADELARRRDRIAGRIESSLRARLDELLPGGSAAVPPERLAQEIVLLAERSDVREELDRLRAHLDHFAQVAGDDGPVGKRLEFLTQEIQRELNTLGAKSRDAETTRRVVDAKVACEQLREQIQNVE
ncbi:MAG: hypothetical protein AMXMBFR36_19620 [Acidobacteriota bacterium]